MNLTRLIATVSLQGIRVSPSLTRILPHETVTHVSGPICYPCPRSVPPPPPPPSPPPPPPGPWLTTLELPGFQVKARFTTGGDAIAGQPVTPCIGETLCVAGALPDRAELFVRVVGPKPNGKLWPTLVKFSTTRIEVWIEQTGSGVVRYYELPEVTPGEQLLSLDGLADKLGFDP
jgi:hypothetical protein